LKNIEKFILILLTETIQELDDGDNGDGDKGYLLPQNFPRLLRNKKYIIQNISCSKVIARFFDGICLFLLRKVSLI
jgi:hypothetical protein